ncbi:MAG: methyl-accepting chemotaxis protein [Paraglaciecola sp.]|jgi:methyl-accepting chemotaxis protein
MDLPWISSSHRIFRAVLVAQWFISLLIAFYTSSWMEPFLLGIPILAFPLALSISNPNAAFSRYAIAVAVQLFAALHIQQAFGMTELHFEVFVMLAFLVYFRDWKVIVISTAVVVVHHISFYLVQSTGGPLVIFEEGSLTFQILLIHAFFAVAEGAVLALMAKRSFAEALTSVLINRSVKTIMHKKDSLNLNIELHQNVEGLDDFNRLIQAFRELIKQANQLSTDVAKVANKVSTSSTQLNKSVAKSAEQLTLISNSIEQMSISIEEVAERSQIANSHADKAKNSTLSTKGTIAGSSQNVSELRKILMQASNAIEQLSTKCNNISEVMQSIKSVAEQTNLLALNAAIESARAGEHGRGFAVVADEVRNLAIKSKESAEEIEQITSGLITSANSSVSQMNDCVKMVDAAVESSLSAIADMDEVIAGFQNVTENVLNVATSTEEQALVAKSISESTQQLGVLSKEEIGHVSLVSVDVDDLQQLCEKLEKQLSQFTV